MDYIIRSRHGSTIYFRIRVPADIRHLVGHTELRRSLHTSNVLLGRSLALQLAHHVKQGFEAMKRQPKKPYPKLVIDLANKRVNLESPYTEQEYQDAVRMVKDLGMGSATPTQQPIEDVWKRYAAEKEATG